ncbi:MAG: metal-sensing transcriptional repressor [Bacilli bacterium]
MHQEKIENCKSKIRGEEEKKQINNRLSRIEGQLRGIRNMVNQDIYCDDILIQVSAAANSLKSLGRLILENHIRTCVVDELKEGNDEIIDELIQAFSKLN